MPAPTIAELLEFERTHFTDSPGRKGDAIRRRFGITHAQYLQRLIPGCRSREGLEADAVTAHKVLDRAARQRRLRQDLLRMPQRVA